MNMQNLMAQAQKMQRDIAKKKDELNKKEFTGESEWVTVIFNGNKDLLSIKINKNDSLDSDDIEMLEDMIKIACDDALNKIDKETKSVMGNYGDLNGIM